MAHRTPQEKKRLSYAKDRRNNYGENDKSSRKNIRRNKRAPHRANRRRESTVLEAVKGAPDVVAEEVAEQRLMAKRRKSWRKFPDAPLADMVAGRLRRRVRLGIDDGVRADERLWRIRVRMTNPRI
jgi:hypothetical protein